MKIKLLEVLIISIAATLLLSGCGRVREQRESNQATQTAQDAGSPPAASTDAPATSAGAPTGGGCGVASKTGSSVQSIESSGVTRSYRLHVPKGYDPSQPTPLVLNFHGFGSNALEQERYAEYPEAADKYGFIVATPDGTNAPRRWYIYGEREQGYVDDFAFTEALIDYLSATLCVDASRVYATGISNGGGMTSLLGCKLNDRIAAIAPVAGSPYADAQCRGKGPMPVIAFHGTDDQFVPFEGGPGGRLGLPSGAVRDNMRDWAKHNGCNMTVQTQRIAADVVLESYGGCKDGADVQLYVVEGGGHTWPGGRIEIPGLGETTHSISATELSWAFFAAHPK
ncbi:MAG TPA: PHB depolymerase family esterase [Dehalococcoidia bacterium]